MNASAICHVCRLRFKNPAWRLGGLLMTLNEAIAALTEQRNALGGDALLRIADEADVVKFDGQDDVVYICDDEE